MDFGGAEPGTLVDRATGIRHGAPRRGRDPGVLTVHRGFFTCSACHIPAQAEADQKKKAVFCAEPAAGRPVGGTVRSSRVCQNVWGLLKGLPSGRQASGPGPP